VAGLIPVPVNGRLAPPAQLLLDLHFHDPLDNHQNQFGCDGLDITIFPSIFPGIVANTGTVLRCFDWATMRLGSIIGPMSTHPDLIRPRDEILRTMERIYRYRMTTTSGGNLSIRAPDGDIWITPAQVDKGGLRQRDIVCVKADGTVEGPHKPSSEFPFHQAIYSARPDIRAIVHAHPVALVAFSICGQVPNARLLHQAWTVCGEVGFAPYALPGSKALGSRLAEAFAQGFHCVILESHGVVVGGDNLQTAFQRFETLEFAAKTIIKATTLGAVQYLSDEDLHLPRNAFEPLLSFAPAPAGRREKELRRQLCDFVRRGYQQRLLISTEGSFSARLDADSFLITPNRVDRNTLDLEDIVLVRQGAAEANKTPSRATRNHQAIYQHHPGIRAIVNAYTVNATAFSVSATKLDSRTIPESYVLLRKIARIAFGVQFRDPDNLACRVSNQQPIALLENDGVLVCGTSVLDAFDRLEVLESTAEAVINARHLGQLTLISDRAAAELDRAFQISPVEN
jgi:L-fuculose-phosphate aldolase